jgi:outer membrane receptor protein involved in Fe transport
MDIGLSKTIELHDIGPWAKRIRFAINVNNLFDKYYFNQAYTQTDYFGNNYLAASPGAPQSVTGSITVQF